MMPHQVAIERTPTRGSALRRLIDPRSVAVIGASTNPLKRGHQAIRAMHAAGFRGTIHPVNPRAEHILGHAVVRSVAELPTGIDVALIALPADAVPGALRDCAAAGIGSVVVLANGFGEIGVEGERIKGALDQAVKETGIRMIGPNTSGLLNATTGANLVGMSNVPKGPVSVITQSGNMLLSLVNDTRALHGPGIHVYVGLGNQGDVRYDEILTELARDPQTGAVAIHSEGFTDGRAFLVAAAAVTAEVPVVLLRGGRSEVGQRAALSHTASVAGSDAVATAVLRQAGVELVDRSDELAVVAGALATTPAMRAGTTVAVLSDGGGHGTLVADALAAQGIPLAPLEQRTRDDLRELLSATAAVGNPIDVAGATDTDPTVFATAADLLMRDPTVGLTLVVGLFGGYHLRFDADLEPAENTTARRMAELSRHYDVPLVVQSCYAPSMPGNHEVLRSHGVPVFASIDDAARVVTALHSRGHRSATSGQRSSLELPESALPVDTAGVALTEPAARRLVTHAGIDVGPWEFAATGLDVADAVRRFGGRCAIKVVSEQVPHKSDVGGVMLDVQADGAADCTACLTQRVRDVVPGAVISGYVVTPMAEAGVELLVGGTRDPIFGPVVAFGSGGVLVEALRDVTFRAAPLTELEATELIGDTIADRLLDGYRNTAAADRKTLARLLVNVGALLSARPEIIELDLNPVIANANRVLPLDVRVVVNQTSQEKHR